MGTRDTIVRAALDCVAERGWEATTLATVQEHAGVSNGSLYHFFPRRHDLAAAVIGDGIAERQRTYLRVLNESSGVADGVTGAVHEHLRWVGQNPNLARLLNATSLEVLGSMADDATISSHLAWWDEIAGWLGDHGWTGTPPLTLLKSLWMGPTWDYALGWLAHPDAYDLAAAAEPLGVAAWAAVAPLLTGR